MNDSHTKICIYQLFFVPLRIFCAEKKNMNNEKTQIVSLEELKELAQKEPYKKDFENLRGIDKTFLEDCPAFQINWRHPRLLFDHLMLEQSMSDYGSNWKFNTNVYNVRSIAYLRYLWYHPLVWLDPKEELRNNHIIEGRIAAERYTGYRENDNFRYGPTLYFRDAMLNWFADNLPKADGTEPIVILNYKFTTTDIILWHYISENPDEMNNLACAEDGRFDPSLVVPFDQRIFLDSVTTIAQTHGGKRAAEIVRLFRKDWKRITTMKLFDINKMSAEQIEEFRVALFEGMDYYLEQWDSELSAEEQETSDASFGLLTDVCYEEEKASKVISEIRTACKGTAVSLWKVIRTNEALGYLGTRGMQTSKIYRAIVDYFGELPYSERNFRDARDKA